MIGKIEYERYKSLIEELTNSKNTVKEILKVYNNEENVVRNMNGFINDLESYIKYLNLTLKMNIDAENVINRNE